MRPDMIVMMPPLLQNNLRFLEGVERFSVQAFIPQTPVEALVVAILPWAAWLNVESFDAQLREPRLDGFCCKFRSVVRADMIRYPACDKQISQNIHHIISLERVARPQ